MIFIGPTPLSGIGQHTKKYLDLFPGSKYYMYHEDIPASDDAFVFALPIKSTMDHIRGIKTKCKNVICMTVCETETVHEDYGLLFDMFDRIAVPSEFCKRVFSRQFPHKEFYIIHAYIPPEPYVFYHIGNVIDPRKNFNAILRAFIQLNIKYPDVRLLVKATCNQGIEIKVKNVEVINGLISDREIDIIHSRGHCYVNASNSEGVGMGAVEAAIRDKPVIATSYGGPSEYLKTPYMIDCELQELERDDFLFKKGMVWGKPNFDQLLEFMEDAYKKRLKFMDHSFTKELVSRQKILEEFSVNIIGNKNEEPHENSAGHDGSSLGD